MIELVQRILRGVHVGLVASAYVGFAVFGVFIGYLALPLATLGGGGPQARLRRRQRMLSRCCRLYVGYMTLVGLIRLDRPPAPIREGEHAALLIANHPSLLDIIMILAVVPHTTFLAKASWFRSPFIGRLLRLGHHIPGPEGGEQTGPLDGALVLEQILERLAEGHSVMLFPEGTRSPPGELGPFKRGAFEAALRAQCPIRCLIMRVKPAILAKGQPWWDVPRSRVHFDVRELATLEPHELAGSSTRALCRQTRERYLRELGLADARDDSCAATARQVSGSPVA